MPERSLRALRTGAFAALWLLFQAATASAGLEVIHESGPTVPIAPYMEPFVNSDSAARPTVVPPSVAQQALPVTFPVKTASMRPGRLSATVRLRSPGLPGPMFIVGDDVTSRQWLVANRDQLVPTGATGVVANVASLESLQALRRLVPGLHLAAASLDSLAHELGLTVYPVFIGADGRVTQKVR